MITEMMTFFKWKLKKKNALFHRLKIANITLIAVDFESCAAMRAYCKIIDGFMYLLWKNVQLLYAFIEFNSVKLSYYHFIYFWSVINQSK